MSAREWFQNWFAARSDRKARQRRQARPAWLRVESLERREVPASSPAWHFDFGPAGSPVAAGWRPVNQYTPLYNPSQGFGWYAGQVLYVDRALGNALTRDFALTTTPNAIFTADVPVGTYLVNVVLGDTGRARDLMNVVVNGQYAGTVNTVAGQSQAVNAVVTVTAGHLNIRLNDSGGANFGEAVQYIGITPTLLKDNGNHNGLRPSAKFTNGGAVGEGGTQTVSFTAVSGGKGPYTYSYDFNNDGTFEVSKSTQPTATVPAQYLADGTWQRAVHGRSPTVRALVPTTPPRSRSTTFPRPSACRPRSPGRPARPRPSGPRSRTRARRTRRPASPTPGASATGQPAPWPAPATRTPPRAATPSR